MNVNNDNDNNDNASDNGYICSHCTYINDTTTNVSCIICNSVLPYYTKEDKLKNDDNDNVIVNDGGGDTSSMKRKVCSDSLQGLESANKQKKSSNNDNKNTNSSVTTTVTCKACTYVNEIDTSLGIDKIDCEICNKTINIPSKLSKENQSPNLEEKNCDNCTFVNSGNSIVCSMCYEPLPNHQKSSSSSSSSSSSLKSDYGIRKYFGNSSSNIKEYSEEALAASTAFNSESATDGIIELLEGALRKAGGGNRFKVCSPFTHISQTGVEIGSKWSCGYRNIQMLCTALLQVPAFKERLFKGDGDIPDVYGLQSWIEKAWDAGFDTLGRDQLGGSLMGTDIWIGATECAALLRYFGLNAVVVDFSIFAGDSSKQLGERLISWIKTYFEYYKKKDGLILPLYFQHDGHSRTIVGYEETQPKTNILIFDPVSSGKTIKQKLINYTSNEPNATWQVMMKRGLHTMVKKEYQIVYVNGIMTPEERMISMELVGISDNRSKIALSTI